MMKLSRNENIALFVSIIFVGYLLFGTTFLNLFMTDTPQENLEARSLPESGVEVQDIKVGEGEVVGSGDTVTVHYVGVLPDGKVFDSSIDRNTPFSFVFGLGKVIKGWEEGLVGMREGGQRRLIVAPDYGYGSERVGSIPPNSTLIFDVELLSVEKPN